MYFIADIYLFLLVLSIIYVRVIVVSSIVAEKKKGKKK